jgi:glycerol-3-phosphate acyltransferase PlsX
VKSVLTTEFKKGWLNMLGAAIAFGAIKALSRRLNPSRYNGASLLGLRGLVFKSHGGADMYAFEWAIRRAYDAAKYDVLARITVAMEKLIPLSDGRSGSGDSLKSATAAPIVIAPTN